MSRTEGGVSFGAEGVGWGDEESQELDLQQGRERVI